MVFDVVKAAKADHLGLGPVKIFVEETARHDPLPALEVWVVESHH
jgi:hypothetical protein